MGEAAGAGLEAAGADIGPEAASAGKGAAPAFGNAAAATAGDAAGTYGSLGADAAASGASASPFVIDSPITPGSLDYLNGAGTGVGEAAGNGLVTADASLNTGPSAFSGAPLDFSSAAGQPLGAGTTPFASGGTTAIAGATPDVASGAALAAPVSGQGATSLAPAASSAAAGTPADATSSWADKLISGAGKSITNNPLGLALGAAGLGYNILNGQKQTANQGALTQAAQQNANTASDLSKAGQAQVTANQENAAQINSQAQGLEQYLTTGQLPTQYTQQIDQAINDAKTTAISNAARNGQPTDPAKNTALAQQLAQIDGQRAGMTSAIAERLFSAGSGLTSTAAGIGNASASSLLGGGQQAAGLSGQLYTTLTGIDSKQSEQTAKAIASLAQSLNGGGNPQKTA